VWAVRKNKEQQQQPQPKQHTYGPTIIILVFMSRHDHQSDHRIMVSWYNRSSLRILVRVFIRKSLHGSPSLRLQVCSAMYPSQWAVTTHYIPQPSGANTSITRQSEQTAEQLNKLTTSVNKPGPSQEAGSQFLGQAPVFFLFTTTTLLLQFHHLIMQLREAHLLKLTRPRHRIEIDDLICLAGFMMFSATKRLM